MSLKHSNKKTILLKLLLVTLNEEVIKTKNYIPFICCQMEKKHLVSISNTSYKLYHLLNLVLEVKISITDAIAK